MEGVEVGETLYFMKEDLFLIKKRSLQFLTVHTSYYKIILTFIYFFLPETIIHIYNNLKTEIYMEKFIIVKTLGKT